MRVIVALEYRFERTPDGTVWTQTTFAHNFWQSYLTIFDQVQVVARVKDVPAVPASRKRANGSEVLFAPIPYYIGPKQYLMQIQHIKTAARRAINPDDAVILRVPSQIANCIEPFLNQTGHPYSLEVVADPYQVFAPSAVKHPLRPFFRWWFQYRLQRQCSAACAVAYVTKHFLQQRYPTSNGVFSTYYSDVELPEAAFRSAPRVPRVGKRTLTLITVGMLDQMYKAPDILIDAVGVCVRDGLDLELVLVGDGRYRMELENRVAQQGLRDHVRFIGQLSSAEQMRVQLDQADLFVLPSRADGLPRAMVEAMARGLPCIGSTVGGIPELLTPEDLVRPDDTVALARKIREVVTSPERLAGMSARNLREAHGYGEAQLQKRKLDFYRHVRQQTEDWIQAHQRRNMSLSHK